MCPVATQYDVPSTYQPIEDIAKTLVASIQEIVVNGKKVSYIPLQKWLPLWLQFNLFNKLSTSSGNQEVIVDITSGSWFAEFLERCPDGHLPVALDIYYDHWKVSKNKKLGGLYITIANLPPSDLMKPDNKFVCSLVPTGVDVQDILFHVLKDFIAHKGLFKLTVDSVTVNLYLEIARIVGDIPGLSELMCVLGHSAISCCRKCTITKDKLLDFTTVYPAKHQDSLGQTLKASLISLKKNQLELKSLAGYPKQQLKILRKSIQDDIGNIKKELQRCGLKGTIPIWMKLLHGNFDMVDASVSCLMHNEELGFLLLEVKLFVKSFSKPQQATIAGNMKRMPKIVGIPQFKASFFEYMDSLLAKEVLAISKGILYCSYSICEETADMLAKWHCLKLHILYFNVIGQPSLPKSIVKDIQTLALAHHSHFFEIYRTKVIEENEAVLAASKALKANRIARKPTLKATVRHFSPPAQSSDSDSASNNSVSFSVYLY